MLDNWLGSAKRKRLVTCPCDELHLASIGQSKGSWTGVIWKPHYMLPYADEWHLQACAGK